MNEVLPDLQLVGRTTADKATTKIYKFARKIRKIQYSMNDI